MTTLTETIGFGGYPAAGILDADNPELVNFDRKRGYPWHPFAAAPSDYFQGASSVGKVVGDDWSWYTRKVTAKWAASHRVELGAMPRQDDAAAYIEREASKKQFEAADKGTLIHAFTAFEDAGRPQGVNLPDELRPYTDSYWAWKEEVGVHFGAIERTGYAPGFGGFGVAGTFDRIVRMDHPPANTGIQPGHVGGVDLKSKTTQPVSKVKPSLDHLLQGVALSQSTHLAIEESRQLLTIPTLSFYVILYLCADGYRAYYLNPHEEELVELARFCVGAKTLSKRINGGAFGTPVVRTLRQDALPTIVPLPTSSPALNPPSPPSAGVESASTEVSPTGSGGTSTPSPFAGINGEDPAEYEQQVIASADVATLVVEPPTALNVLESLEGECQVVEACKRAAGHDGHHVPLGPFETPDPNPHAAPSKPVRMCERCNHPLPAGSHGRRKFHADKATCTANLEKEQAA